MQRAFKTVYQVDGFDGEPAAHEVRRMDCMDCHNRPAHVYTTPNDAVDHSIFMGRMDRSLPELKYNVVDLLTTGYENREQAQEAIRDGLDGVL